MPRQLPDWIAAYLKCTETQESPAIFHTYCGLSIIGMAAGRKCILDRGFYKIYPNLYVILIAGSGLARKSAAIGIAENILHEAVEGIDVVTCRLAPEMLLDKLAAARMSCGRSEARIIVSELGTFFRKDTQNNGLVQLLTDLYDCKERGTYETIGRGKRVYEKAFSAFLTGTTPIWMAQTMPEGSMEGGFTSRVLFVYSTGTGKRTLVPTVNQGLWTDLVGDLKTIANLEGEFKLTPAALNWMTDWYEHKFKPQVDNVLDGYLSRKHDHIFKLSMLLSLSKRDNLQIELEDVKKAHQYIEELEKDLPKVTMKLTETTEGAEINSVLKVIASAGPNGIKHVELLKRVVSKMGSMRAKMCLESLMESGLVEVLGPITMQNALVYKVKESQGERF